MKAGGYTLDIYCDSGANHSRMEIGEFHFHGETFKECKRKAERLGWRVGEWGEPDLCPQCAKQKQAATS